MIAKPHNPLHAHSSRCYVAYDAESGDVVHVHRVTSFLSGTIADVAADHRRVLEMAGRAGHDAGRLRVLALDPSALDLQHAHRVDLETMRVVRGTKV